jgi:uracil-DNA glycosylase
MFIPLKKQDNNLIKSRQDLLQLMDNLMEDNLKQFAGRVVYPVGDGSSKIMFIGEAPGQKEDQLGEPFVGASGNLLNKILLPSVGLNRSNIYLTNIVKRRPPNNRDPLDLEKEQWSHVLAAEIQFVQPHLIVCLGRHSLSFFIEKPQIGKIHGVIQNLQVLENNNPIAILPLYHPAVALYNPNMKSVLQKDFLIIKEYINQDTVLSNNINNTNTLNNSLIDVADIRNTKPDGALF